MYFNWRVVVSCRVFFYEIVCILFANCGPGYYLRWWRSDIYLRIEEWLYPEDGGGRFLRSVRTPQPEDRWLLLRECVIAHCFFSRSTKLWVSYCGPSGSVWENLCALEEVSIWGVLLKLIMWDASVCSMDGYGDRLKREQSIRECSCHTDFLTEWSRSVAYRGGVGVFNPPSEILKALQNRAKLNPIVKTVKNCWI